jgi:SAM-dependent methyltransferase
MELRFESVDGATRLTVEHRGWGSLITAKDATGWFASAVAAPFFHAATPGALTDWITDRLARRPSGADSRAIYRNPIYHYPNFRVILAELDLKPTDYLLEVACGGGALLREALKSGCRAAAIDHSMDMVRVARENNREAIDAGRFEVLQASADRLPFTDDTFSCAAMTGVLGFLQNPVRALAEVRRVLRSHGRFVALGSDPKWRGTPAAPEPIASRLHFYDDDELGQLACDAGFDTVQVVRRSLEPYARESGVPEEHVPMFAGDEPFLIAHRS